MPATWNHPELGRFKYDWPDWVKLVPMPAFKAFSLYGRSKGKHDLVFESDDENDIPKAQVALASRVLANQSTLVKKVIKALWDDFNGNGPDSGMWWHGDLKQVADGMEGTNPPSGPEDLLKLMQVNKVMVHKSIHGYDKPIVELNFHAAFEDEHGVGVLTDGRSILGTGYSVDVDLFEKRRKRK